MAQKADEFEVELLCATKEIMVVMIKEHPSAYKIEGKLDEAKVKEMAKIIADSLREAVRGD